MYVSIIGIPYTDFRFGKRRCILEIWNCLIILIIIQLGRGKIASSFDDARYRKITHLNIHENENRNGQGYDICSKV